MACAETQYKVWLYCMCFYFSYCAGVFPENSRSTGDTYTVMRSQIQLAVGEFMHLANLSLNSYIKMLNFVLNIYKSDKNFRSSYTR
jgi:hypothetical protein